MNANSPGLHLYVLVLVLFTPVSALAWNQGTDIPQLNTPQHACHVVSSENEDDKKEIVIPKEESQEEDEDEEPDCD